MSGPLRSIFLSLAVLATGTASQAQSVDPSTSASPPLISTAPDFSPPNIWSLILEIHGGATVLLAACCKTCQKGKACGDSCISRSYTCRKGFGCACDG